MIAVLSQRAMKYSMRLFLKNKSQDVTGPHNQLYFAFGANLSPERLAKNFIKTEVIGPAVASGHKIDFSMPCEYQGKGFASLTASLDSRAWGILFRVSPAGLLMFDILEWVPYGSYKRVKITVKVAGEVYNDVWAYVAKNPKTGLRPSVGYLNTIIAEAVRLGFPDEYIVGLKRVEAREKFLLDPGFSLLNQNRRRLFEDKFKSIYLLHDKLREKVAGLLP